MKPSKDSDKEQSMEEILNRLDYGHKRVEDKAVDNEGTTNSFQVKQSLKIEIDPFAKNYLGISFYGESNINSPYARNSPYASNSPSSSTTSAESSINLANDINETSEFSTTSIENNEVERLNPSHERFKVVDDRYVKINPNEKENCLTCNRIEYSKEYKGTIINKEIIKFNHVYGDQSKIDPRLSCSQTRTKYIRFIAELYCSITNITYAANAEFNDLHPYEPQYVRYEVKEDRSLNRGTTSGLCPYCEEIKFLPFKNSSYLSHLSLEHGIFATGYLVPEPQVIDEDGKFSASSGVTSEAKNQVLCPVCGYIVLTNCWRSKENPFLIYYHHFNEVHSIKTHDITQEVNQQAPLWNRGRDIKPFSGTAFYEYTKSAARRSLDSDPNHECDNFPTS
ncbi:hypothetical protein DFJ63DRAFT_332844 [Scheffersomyces coipomensis]|uniref:uncharacterized protein n=1 Tax=Scheffersomyces coipomensis TaxID=1788519 RepID=UPI00315CEA37